MGKAFIFDSKELKQWRFFYREFPKIYERAQINTLNNLAFQGRQKALEEVDKNMTIRSPAFVKGSMRFQKANLNKPESEFGSIKRNRFSGWEEQQTGKQTERTRVQTLQARRRNWKNRVAPRARLKPGNKFIRPKDLKLDKLGNNKIPAFLDRLDRVSYKQPFFIPVRYKRLQRGIYLFVNKKIRRLQSFDPKKVQPKKDEWMTRAVGSLGENLVDAYKEGLEFAYKKALKRSRL